MLFTVEEYKKRLKITNCVKDISDTFIEPLITKAKKGDLNSIRQVEKKLSKKNVVHTLVHDIAPVYAERNGGYTRIIKLGFRDNDRASVSLIELVDYDSVDSAEVVKASE